jgi:hypothetical protein
MCRSRPRLRVLAQESWRRILGRTISTGVDTDVNSSGSSLPIESTLPDSWGTSGMLRAAGVGMSFGRVAVGGADLFSVSQQKVSLFQSRQERFSSRRPCSTESAHREKTVG